MAKRQCEDVDFEYDVTDPAVIGQKIREIIGHTPRANRFRITGWRPPKDRAGGYFRVSYVDEAA
ncbi:hypothetical protein [Nocardia sp. N2S4-5]|uniref:hypothetical protein n=1 Tax=Nocardia sp. N2S4-5 TaxID=3351565 RepID=UPI0037D94DB7